MQIRVEQIRQDESAQIRDGLNSKVVAEYQRCMKEAGTDPIDVFKVNGDCLLADGFHRLAAAKRLGWTEIDCNVHEGDRRDLLLFAAGANAKHGQPLSSKEKRKAIKVLLADEEWFQWSNARIARHCGVSAPTVASVRESYLNEIGKQNASNSAGSSGSIKKSLIDEKRKRINRHGNLTRFKPSAGRSGKAAAVTESSCGDSSRQELYTRLAGTFAALAALSRETSGELAWEGYGDLLESNAEPAIRFVSDYAQARKRRGVA